LNLLENSMKKIVLFFALAFAVTNISLAQQKDIPGAKPGVKYGKEISASNAISVAKLEKELTQKNALGKSQAEIDQITQPKKDISIIADGVLVVK